MKLALFALFCALQLIAGLDLTDFIFYPPEGISNRIVGGDDAADGEVPFQCSIQLNKRHFCGCSLVSGEWIVTASHCVYGQRPEYIEILVGTNDLTSGGTYYKIANYTTHENYNKPNFANDIAVIRVQGTITFSDKIQPIGYSAEEVPDGAVLQLTGWGRTSAGGPIPKLLQIIKLKAVSTEKCRKIYGGRNVHASHICTLNHAGEGACNGDSGGPLVYNNQLVGVVNWGVPCALGYPDAYAKVSYLYDWIKEHTQ